MGRIHEVCEGQSTKGRQTIQEAETQMTEQQQKGKQWK